MNFLIAKISAKNLLGVQLIHGLSVSTSTITILNSFPTVMIDRQTGRQTERQNPPSPVYVFSSAQQFSFLYLYISTHLSTVDVECQSEPVVPSFDSIRFYSLMYVKVMNNYSVSIFSTFCNIAKIFIHSFS